MQEFNNLGRIIKSDRIREAIYATYSMLVIVYFGVDAFSSGAGLIMPAWYGGVSNALIALAVPVSTLALANAKIEEVPAEPTPVDRSVHPGLLRTPE